MKWLLVRRDGADERAEKAGASRREVRGAPVRNYVSFASCGWNNIASVNLM
jgi:hypothetical protein